MYVGLNAREADALAEAARATCTPTSRRACRRGGGERRGARRGGGGAHEQRARRTTAFPADGRDIDKNPSSAVQYRHGARGYPAGCSRPTAPGSRTPRTPGAWRGVRSAHARVARSGCRRHGGARHRRQVAHAHRVRVSDPDGHRVHGLKRYQVAPETYEELARDVDEAAVAQGEPIDIYATGSFAYRITEMNAFLSDAARVRGVQPSDLTRAIAEGTAWGASTSGMFSSTTLAGYAMMVVVSGGHGRV
ncbi:MAG: hypothetical protein ACLSVD_05625 [Eggerthellaceae bacterium]